MERHNPLADRQPQAGTSLGPGPGFVHHIERLGDPAQILRRNSPAIIRHPDTIAIRNHSTLQKDMSPRLHSLAGVIHQIQQYRLHQVRIDLGRTGIRPDLQADSRLLQGWAQRACRLLQKSIHLRPPGSDAFPFQHKDIHQLAGQAFQTPPLPKDVFGTLSH